MLQEFSTLNQYMTVILIRTDAERESKMHELWVAMVIVHRTFKKCQNFAVKS